MENCISKLPSLKEAMKLSANELTKYSAESSVSLFVVIRLKVGVRLKIIQH
jgi:hypothetical protein